jgi:hypothetical protein
MRAARLLEAVTIYGSQVSDTARNGNSRGGNARPWLQNKTLMALTAADDLPGVLSKAEQLDPAWQLKVVSEMTGMEQQRAAAAAAAWAAEIAKTQQLMAELVQRAETAEIALASARLARHDKQQECQGSLGRRLGGRTVQSASAFSVSLAAKAADADDDDTDNILNRLLPPASSSHVLALPPAQHVGDQQLQDCILQLQQQLLGVQAELRSVR